MTPAGIEPATFRFVAQHLNHCATAVPEYSDVVASYGVTCVTSFIKIGPMVAKLKLKATRGTPALSLSLSLSHTHTHTHTHTRRDYSSSGLRAAQADILILPRPTRTAFASPPQSCP